MRKLMETVSHRRSASVYEKFLGRMTNDKFCNWTGVVIIGRESSTLSSREPAGFGLISTAALVQRMESMLFYVLILLTIEHAIGLTHHNQRMTGGHGSCQ